MDLSRITTAYRLHTLEVRPSDLLLDPSNPRLITDGSGDRDYAVGELRSPVLQKEILGQVCMSEHHVTGLIESIRSKGFLGGLHEMIVQRLGNREFLVLEGNRRAAALKFLLNESEGMSPEVRKTIQTIEVKEFVYLPNPMFDEQDVIDVLLGSIHIDGPEEWGAMQKARYIHRTYQRMFTRERGDCDFRFDRVLAGEVGDHFNLGVPTVQNMLIVYRVYDRLKKAGQAVTPAHYSLLELAAKTKALADYFEIDKESCSFSEVGLEHFVALCVGGRAPVHNPKLFRDFAYIRQHGTENDVSLVEDGSRPLEAVKRRVKRRSERYTFQEEVAAIATQIGEIRVTDFRGTDREKREIRRLWKVVNKRLRPLI